MNVLYPKSMFLKYETMTLELTLVKDSAFEFDSVNKTKKRSFKIFLIKKRVMRFEIKIILQAKDV